MVGDDSALGEELHIPVHAHCLHLIITLPLFIILLVPPYPNFRLAFPCAQCITLDHKEYEKAIDNVKASFKRSLGVNQKRRLELIKVPASTTPATGSSQGRATFKGSSSAARKPNYFREVRCSPGVGESSRRVELKG